MTTERLLIRRFDPDDWRDLFEYLSQEAVVKKLLERLRFRREGHLLQDTCFKKAADGDPIWTDTYIYGILASEWR